MRGFGWGTRRKVCLRLTAYGIEARSMIQSTFSALGPESAAIIRRTHLTVHDALADSPLAA